MHSSFVVHQCIKVAIHLFEDVLGKHTRQSLGRLWPMAPWASAILWHPVPHASCFNPLQLLNTSDTSQAKRCQDTFNFVGFSPVLPWKKWSMCTRACSLCSPVFDFQVTFRRWSVLQFLDKFHEFRHCLRGIESTRCMTRLVTWASTPRDLPLQVWTGRQKLSL